MSPTIEELIKQDMDRVMVEINRLLAEAMFTPLPEWMSNRPAPPPIPRWKRQ